MSEESDRTLDLLQELAALKDIKNSGSREDAAASGKRRREIGKELKQLAKRKKMSK